MKSRVWWKVSLVGVLFIAIIAVIALKDRAGPPRESETGMAEVPEPAAAPVESASPESAMTGESELAPVSEPSGLPEETISGHKPASETNDAVSNAAMDEGGEGEATPNPPSEVEKPKALPRLVEVGANACLPCKMMQPILAELREEYAGKLQVDFVDVWKHPEKGSEYRVQVIPTQVFFDVDGKEVFRHMGFYPKDEIVAKLKELGFVS